ncbi:hypothetical protein [Phenylobacterium sp.]|jgi:hypothetical protein|uniref:hypothetical protein n=1 Tax=Phenylobacterium sp. TaxID=1871053 RepID=UPI002F409A9B
MPPTNRAEVASQSRETLAGAAFRWVVLGGLVLSLAANLPGHMTFDSVVQLFEGRMGVHLSFNPPVMSWLLGRFDHILPGTGLYVAACAAVLFASLASLAALRPRTSWIGVILALALLLTPQVLLYQGIVWKDVLFANLAIAGFVCLAYAARDWTRGAARLAPLAGALLFLAVAGLVRQNGLLIQALAAVALGWTAWGRGWGRGVAWGVGGFVALVLASQAIGTAVEVKGATQAGDLDRGLRVLQHYDIVGAVAHDPGVRLDVLEKAAPATAAAIRSRGVKVYSPERVDTLSDDPIFSRELWQAPEGAAGAQWRSLILHQPLAYLRERIDVYRWLIAPPKIDRCLPYTIGVDGPPDKMDALELPHGWDPQDMAMAAYTQRFVHTPLFSHLSYAAAASAVALVLLLRRDPADMAVVGLMLAGLGFAASFFVMSIACDYRYLYFLDLAAITGVIYVALDPPWPRRKRARA